MVITAIIAVYLIGVFLNILGIAHSIQRNIKRLYGFKEPFWDVFVGMEYSNVWWLSWIGVVYYILSYNKWNE